MFTWYTKTQIITLSQIIKQIAWLVSAVSKVQRLAEVIFVPYETCLGSRFGTRVELCFWHMLIYLNYLN